MLLISGAPISLYQSQRSVGPIVSGFTTSLGCGCTCGGRKYSLFWPSLQFLRL
ncbi:hypothetical protein [Cohnella massiliensis]|uniref:hypothetical protein n=1 Tax=Cohnella massiliensis TaxID=1816691 RepID=UPI001FE29199|nr:hypothetical protein [Cohnella massiliensis]